MTEPSIAICIVCPTIRADHPPRTPNNPPVCDGCRERIEGELTDMPAAYANVEVTPGRGGGEASRMKGFESTPPLNIHALSLIAHGSLRPSTDGTRLPQDQLGVVPPVDTLWWWVEDWIEVRAMREHMPAADIVSLTRWLLNRLDWAMDSHNAVDEFARDVVACGRALRGVLQSGERRGEPAGRCPAVTRSETRCGTRLYVDPYVDQICCTRCGTTWDRGKGDWVRLSALQAEMEAA